MWLFLTARAFADVVDGPAEDCPPGSVGAASHYGPYCRPAACDDNCAGDCASAGLCIVEHTVTRTYTGPSTWEEAVSACDGPEDCTGDATCRVQDRCVLPSADSGSKRSIGRCGCSTEGALPGAVFGLALATWAVSRPRVRASGSAQAAHPSAAPR